jgi:hypothetical protein
MTIALWFARATRARAAAAAAAAAVAAAAAPPLREYKCVFAPYQINNLTTNWLYNRHYLLLRLSYSLYVVATAALCSRLYRESHNFGW